MHPDLYKNLCIFNIYNGLLEGLSHFSQSSRVALIYTQNALDPLRIYDPQNLLKGHAVRLKEIYNGSDAWRTPISTALAQQPRGHFLPSDNLDLAGVISFGGSAHSFFYQMWFTDHHPDMCSIYPTQRWLEHAAWLLAQDFASDSISMGTSGHALQNYAIHAITDHIVDVRNNIMGLDTRMLIHPILDTILNISKTREEGAWPRGRLVFMDPDTLGSISFIAKVQRHERPYLANAKHIRKLLLAVENSDRNLISDGNTIIGISASEIPPFAVVANYQGDHGFLELAGTTICSFSDGNFQSTTRRAKLAELEELLLDYQLDIETFTDLFKTIAQIVHTAENRRHGCTLVIDFNKKPVMLSGHVLEPCLSLRDTANLDLACSLIKIDGALHIMSTIALKGFACLLDGKAIPGENRARGARYNSALRFTAEHDNVIVVVVSSDRPVSIIHNGIELNALCQWNPLPGFPAQPQTLSSYLSGELHEPSHP
ncbi:MAG: DNA integrity scanning protein DisA nucleotide-binding domain protein [Pseudomonadota bacterium]